MWPRLVCPKDGLFLSRLEEHLMCSQGHQWKIVRDIPRLVSEINNYAESFGVQWRKYRRTQLDSYTKATISYDRARRCLGEECWKMLHRYERTDVLEVGCGAGRFTEVLLNTNAFVTSIDYSSAVEANHENFPQNQHHRVLQADALCLPFPPQQFDLVFCLGVIQHTQKPEETIEKIYQMVKPGGWLVIDHYTYNIEWFTRLAAILRFVFRRLPPEKGLQWTEYFVKTFLPLHRAVRKSQIARVILGRISPVWSYYNAYPEFDDGLQYEWAFLDTHDALTDWYKHFRTKGQINRALKNVGVVAITCEYGGNGVEARCRRPEAVN